MTRKLRVGVIGAGIAARHMSGYDWNKDLYEVKVICSLDADRGVPLAEKHGVPEYTQDVETLYARDDLDVIDVSHGRRALHFEMTKRALAAGQARHLREAAVRLGRRGRRDGRRSSPPPAG